MGYLPSNQEVSEAFKSLNSVKDEYRQAYTQFGERMVLLHKQEKINVHKSIEGIVLNWDKPLKGVEHLYCGMLPLFAETKESVESSDDELLKQLYEKCLDLHRSCEYLRNGAIGKMAIKNTYDHAAALSKMADKRF